VSMREKIVAKVIHFQLSQNGCSNNISRADSIETLLVPYNFFPFDSMSHIEL